MEFPEIKIFSVRNLKYMRKFVDEYQDEKFLQEVLAKITWYHNAILMEQENLITASCKSIKNKQKLCAKHRALIVKIKIQNGKI